MYTKHCYILEKGDTNSNTIQVLCAENNNLWVYAKYAHNKVWQKVVNEINERSKLHVRLVEVTKQTTKEMISDLSLKNDLNSKMWRPGAGHPSEGDWLPVNTCQGTVILAFYIY